MIEWTICEACGKILDNDLNTCPDCGSVLKKIDLNYIKDYYFKFIFAVKVTDITGFEISDKDFPLSCDLKSKNLTIENVIHEDMINWLSYLGWGDGEITDNELEFINTLFNVEYTKEDISNISDSDIQQYPLSFKLLDEQALFKKPFDFTGFDYCSVLYSIYELTGKFFITVNGVLDDDVLKRCTDYLKTLKNSFEVSDVSFNVNIKESLPEESDSLSESDEKTLDDYLNELNRLIGLEKVKKDVNSLINLVQIRKIRSERGIKQPSMSLHLVFSGNPGTGKTTVARLLSKIYKEIGILSKGHLVECDRSGLVGGYVGQTAIKTQEMITSSLGGILFIDEAYSLAKDSENDYGGEAIDTILKAMEDNRDDFIVIVAGYPELMDKFLSSNPGLESRFNKFIYFEDYSEEELYEIFKLMCDESNLVLDNAGDEYVREYFKKVIENKPKNFANGRAVRNFFEEVITAQANRLAPKSDITDEELNTLTYEDFLTGE